MEEITLTIRPDGRQSQTAHAVQRGVCRLLRNLGFATLMEVTLASGRRADVMALKGDGSFWIVEIKSSPEDFRADQKWHEYRAFCDRYFFAIPATMDHGIIPVEAGLIIADQWGAEIMREAEVHRLHASRRKALTLAYGRAAATRLHNLWDPT